MKRRSARTAAASFVDFASGFFVLP
jgi:hypothetical protein